MHHYKLLFHSVFWEVMGLEQYTHSSSLSYPSRFCSELLMSCASLTDGCLSLCLCLVLVCLWGIWSRNIDGFNEGCRAGKEERDIGTSVCSVMWFDGCLIWEPWAEKAPGLHCCKHWMHHHSFFYAFVLLKPVSHLHLTGQQKNRVKQGSVAFISACLVQVWARPGMNTFKKKMESS